MEERPYLANYAIGLIMLIGIHMLFNIILSIFYPDYFQNEYFTSFYFQIFFLGAEIILTTLAVSLFFGSGIGYKITILVVGGLLLFYNVSVMIGGDFGAYMWFEMILCGLCLALLLIPKSVRQYYKGWNISKQVLD